MRWEQGCRSCEVRNEFIIPEINELIKILRPTTVLDVGCGTGYIARNLIANNDPNVRWTLVDIDEERLNLAKDLITERPNVAILNRNILLENSDSLRADLVLIANTLLEFHLNQMELSHIAGLVRPRGHLSIFIPDTLSDIIHAKEEPAKYLESVLQLNKVDKFTDSPYPFFAHRAVTVIIKLIENGFELIRASRTELGNGQFHFCFRKAAVST